MFTLKNLFAVAILREKKVKSSSEKVTFRLFYNLQLVVLRWSEKRGDVFFVYNQLVKRFLSKVERMYTSLRFSQYNEL